MSYKGGDFFNDKKEAKIINYYSFFLNKSYFNKPNLSILGA